MQRVLADFQLSPNQIILLVSGALLIYLIRRWRQITLQKQKSTGAAARYTAPAARGSPLSVREVATELQALLAELEESSRRLTAQLDNRHTRIEQLLAEADEKIARLERLSAGTAAAPSIETPPVPRHAPVPMPPVASEAERMLHGHVELFVAR